MRKVGEEQAMPRILNYKSYYEAFRLGVIDDGFTPVGRLLFFPLFDPDGEIVLCDETGVLYEVNNKNASAWGNGTEPIPQKIQTEIGKKETLEIIIKYFTSKDFTQMIVDAKEDEMYEAVITLVKECEISDSKKKALLKYYKGMGSYEFLARVFQRAVLGDNKVTSSKKRKKAADKEADSVMEFDKLVRRKKPEAKVPKRVQQTEIKYVMQLYAAYSDATGKPIKKASDLDELDYRDDFEHHRKNYYKAELVCRETRDSVKPDEENPITELLDEVEEGIYETRRRAYDDALLRVNAVMEQASKVPIASWVDDATFNWIGPAEKKGVCHILVNDERFKWVEA